MAQGVYQLLREILVQVVMIVQHQLKLQVDMKILEYMVMEKGSQMCARRLLMMLRLAEAMSMPQSLPGRSDNEIKNYWYTQKKRHQITATSFKEQILASSSVPYIVSSPKLAPNTIYAALVTLSIYDILKTKSTRNPTANPIFLYIGPTYEQNGAANNTMLVVPSAELFAHMSAPITLGNIGAGDYPNFGIQ